MYSLFETQPANKNGTAANTVTATRNLRIV
jgi:hypothetical protein